MNCQECLATLATASAAELEQSDLARQHYATCPDCSRVIKLVVGAERDLGAGLNKISSNVPAAITAETAIAVAKRRRTGKLLAVVFAVLIAATLWVTWIQVIVPSMRATAELARPNLVTETIKLQCLSSEQAGDLISPYVRSNGSIYYVAKPPLKILTVRATPEELRAVKTLLERFDSPAEAPSCAVP